MTLADLRKEIKTLRKETMPVPVSRMKKADCVAELERLKGLRGGEEKAVKEVLKEEKVPKKAVKKVEAVHKEEHKKQDEVEVKKTKGVKRSASPPPAKKAKVEAKPKADKPKADKPGKGSEEMKAKMAKLREMRKAKKEA